MINKYDEEARYEIRNTRHMRDLAESVGTSEISLRLMGEGKRRIPPEFDEVIIHAAKRLKRKIRKKRNKVFK